MGRGLPLLLPPPGPSPHPIWQVAMMRGQIGMPPRPSPSATCLKAEPCITIRLFECPIPKPRFLPLLNTFPQHTSKTAKLWQMNYLTTFPLWCQHQGRWKTHPFCRPVLQCEKKFLPGLPATSSSLAAAPFWDRSAEGCAAIKPRMTHLTWKRLEETSSSACPHPTLRLRSLSSHPPQTFAIPQQCIISSHLCETVPCGHTLCLLW